jgi:PAP2 superfamily protein
VHRALVIVCVITLVGAHAHADEPPKRWYQGKHGTNRVVHFSITTAALLAHPALTFLEEGIECNWCGGPNALDAKVRNSLVWSDTKLPARMSDISSYVLAPTAAYGLVLAGTLATPSTAALMDDMIPIAEAMIVTQWVTRALKITIARTRPYAHFTDETSNEDNLSFPSGHTSLPFALATSAGMIAHSRGYKSEPYIWAIGITLALSSGYLRIAADRHYVTDVATGALIGVSAGLTVPLLMSRDNVRLTPMGTGMAFAGVW